ncbi:hypothetical protein BDQ17DRAFT_1249129 [Cyathus striatus]|nr:hypothetical protein BDQ17DRAFT_1249129 [Cyathus striatus]
MYLGISFLSVDFINLLVTWTGVFVKGIPDLFQYLDDVFGTDCMSALSWYEPYP